MTTTNNYQTKQYILPRYNNNHEMSIDMSMLKNWQIINNIVDVVNADTKIINHLSDENQCHSGTVYNLISTQVNINDTNDFTYGICVQQDGHMIDYALGLSKDYEKILSFVTLCNKNALSVVHFRDVIEDFFDCI